MRARVVAQSSMAMEMETVQANIRANIARGLPQFHEMPYWQRFKGEHPIALIGGGPSLADYLEKLRAFRHTLVCGSAHDFVVQRGVEPEFTAVLDPDPIAANYLRNPCKTTTYLIASSCDAAVFDALKHHQIVLWHCAGTVGPELVAPHHAIGGGCTVGLRAIGLALLMGYGNQHFFGFDSCYAAGRSHAYDAEEVDAPIDVQLMGSDRIYSCAPYHMAQAQQFQDILRQHGKYLTPTIHGDGLIADIMRVGTVEAAKMEEVA
jgi:hypothetical protein